MTLRLVHLSDIHFQGYGRGWDVDRDQREQLLADLKPLASAGPIDGIIVGGDVAFSAAPDEYESARAWLADVVATCHVDSSRVWTVPGNHDVDRGMVEASAVAQEFRRAVRQCNPAAIDQELRRRLSQDPAREGVMMPFQNYNSFADEFRCSTTAQQPHWFDDTLSIDGLPLRLTGFNSALASDRSDSKDQGDCQLVLGTWQCNLPRQDRLLHIAITHHPREWLRDWNVIEPYLRRAHVVLFGHEHRFAAEQTVSERTVYVYAGAVGPERLGGDPGDEYLPSWAFITLENHDPLIRVVVEPRVWHRDQTCFGPHPDGMRDFSVRVDLMEVPGAGSKEDEKASSAGIDASPLILPETREMTDEPPPSPSERRKLGVQFSSLPPTRRLEIARALGVLEEPADLDLPRPKLYETILTRIRERNLIESLERELNRG